MPSTAIFSYKFVNENFKSTPVGYTEGVDSGELRRLSVDNVLADTNNGYMVEYPLPQTI